MFKHKFRNLFGPGRHAKLAADQAMKRSFSQSGEDLIVDYIFHWLGLDAVKYLDIGAHHPYILSNTFHFYQKGHSGVLVEPDPQLHAQLERSRQRDQCLNVGAASRSQQTAKYYEMSDKALSTFSWDEARRYESYGRVRIEAVHEIPLLSVNTIIERHFADTPNFISIDVEGLDYEILEGFDFQRYRPEVFCVETLTYTEDKSERKVTELIDLMREQHYFAYADTYLNTIFVDHHAWNRRRP